MILPRIRAANLESPQVPISSDAILTLVGGQPVASGATVTKEGSLAIPAVWRSVNLIAGTIASLPLHVYRPTPNGREKLGSNSQTVKLWSNPHEDMTSYEFWETVISHILLWGNAYLLRNLFALGGVRSFTIIHPSRVSAGRASDGSKTYLIDRKLGCTDREILHLPGFGYDGTVGLSPITIARQGIGLALSAEEYAARLFGSGSLATGLLETDQRLTPDQADSIQARWRAKRSGLGGAHETIVLDSGAKFHQLTMPNKDTQFLESRSFQVSEIARIFGIPPHMLMDTDKSTSWGTGIEQQSIGWVVYTLRPWLTRIEQRISRTDVFPTPAYARFSVEGLLRGDSAQRSAFYTAMWNIGVFSTNDIRRFEEAEPVEGGDVRYRPLNMGVLGESDSPTSDPADLQDPQEAFNA